MKGRLGRVARQRSAKPCTAVRIRQAPHQKTPENYRGFYLFYLFTPRLVKERVQPSFPGCHNYDIPL